MSVTRCFLCIWRLRGLLLALLLVAVLTLYVATWSKNVRRTGLDRNVETRLRPEEYKRSQDEYYNKEEEKKDRHEKEITGVNFINESLWYWGDRTRSDIANISVLSRRLFYGVTKGQKQKEQNFTILIWKHGKTLERRQLRRFGNTPHDPFADCSVKNCRITYADEDIKKADAVVFHLHRTKSPSELPQTRILNQRWVFLSDESPYNTFLLSRNYSIWDYNGMFNWSMTYRVDSDVPVPYGRTVPLGSADIRMAPVEESQKTGLVAIMGSNCGGNNKRWDYVKEMEKFVKVDKYGGCGDIKTCPGHFAKDCPDLAKYKFYFAFENGNCLDYVTEKAWWNAFHKGTVPIVMGPPRRNYERLFPPNSFLHVDDFNRPADLANYILYLSQNRFQYRKFFEWRRHYKVLNEHGYFNTPVRHYCRLCEALNYNSEEKKTYDRLENYWNPKLHCYLQTWKKRMTGTFN